VKTLSVWLRSQHLGELTKLNNGRLRLRYSEQALSTYGAGARPLSLSLPLTAKRIEGDALERFCDNLLPEGAVRGALEREHSVRPGDAFDLLAVIGGECAGAIQFSIEGDPVGTGTLTPLTDEQVAAIVRDLPTHTAPEGMVVEASLGGVQDKVLLTRTEQGWAWPSGGAMSTHLIKPEPITQVVVPQLIRYEHWALAVAAQANIPAARADLDVFDGREALVIERFDRADGVRTHQEDFTQALGLASRDKYESTVTEHRLAALAAVAAPESRSPDAFLAELLAQVTFNVAIGNADAHSKNYSVRIDPTATVSMTPMYDVAPVYLVATHMRHAGHAVNEQVYLPFITVEHLLAEAQSWGMSRPGALDVVSTVLRSVTDAIEATGNPPTEIPVADLVRGRVNLLIEALPIR
jgi:serine/threonine-protein kinase HipA